MSDSFRPLMINERTARFFSANRSFALSLTKNEQFTQKNLTKIEFFGIFFVQYFLDERFAHSFFLNERCEQIAQVAHQK